MISFQSHCALILPGAVAKGAYEAGVIQVLAEQNTRVDRIVCTSSGALNGVAFAAGIRSGHEEKMVERLVNAWIEGGGWNSSLNFNPWHFVTGKGLSDRRGLMKMLTGLIHPCRHSQKREVELRIIVAPLKGILGKIGHHPATTYEKVLHFSGKDFDTAEGLAKIFDATTAACAFPGLFAPVEIEGLGPCVDGGTVNNAPIRYALDECGVNQIIVPVPFVALMDESPPMRGLNLVNHLVEILINERLYRDLKDAEVVNQDVTALDNLALKGTLTKQQVELVKSVLSIRKVEITEVRPAEVLKGGSFSGFFSKYQRRLLVEEGRKAARKTLSKFKDNQPAARPADL